MAITRGARRSDVIREAVANAVAAIDPSSLLPRTPVNPLRHPLWWIRTQAAETRPYRWLRRLKLIAKTRANGGVCSIELRNPHMGFFAQVYWCIAIFQYCEWHGLTPHIRCTGLNYVDAERGQDWLEDYFTKLQSETSDLRKVRYTSTIYDVKLVGLAVRQHTGMEEARCVFNRHLRVKPHIIEIVEQFWEHAGRNGPVFGIHYRGTDKSLEAPRVSLEHCLTVVKRYIRQNPDMSAVFVASDEQRFIEPSRKRSRSCRYSLGTTITAVATDSPSTTT